MVCDCLLFSSLLCRSFHKGDIVSSSRVIVGVDAAIADAASLALMVESVGLGTEQWKDAVKRYLLRVLTFPSLVPFHTLFLLNILLSRVLLPSYHSFSDAIPRILLTL